MTRRARSVGCGLQGAGTRTRGANSPWRALGRCCSETPRRQYPSKLRASHAHLVPQRCPAQRMRVCVWGPEVAFQCVCAQNDQSEMKVGYLKLCSRGSGNPAFIWFLVFPFALPAHWRAIASRAQHRRVENSQTDAHASTWMYAYKDTRPSASKVCIA